MKPARLFCSYSHRDEDLRDALREHLVVLEREGLIAEWHDRKIVAGDLWKTEIEEQLNSADIILVLLSPSYIASEFCWKIELPKALERQERRETKIIPAILRPCLWENTPLARLQAVPKNARAVTNWPNQDEAFFDIVKAIRLAAEDIIKKRKYTENDDQRKPGLADVSQAPLVVSPTLADFQTFREVDAFWCPEMVMLPGGSFLMGAPAEDSSSWPDEKPQLQVTIAYRLAIGQFPVMLVEYDEFCEAVDRPKLDDEGWGRDRHPAINVSWRDARAYAEWLSQRTSATYRLPSEAEWEYACRAMTTTAYSRGDHLTEGDANFGGKLGGTTYVGSYSANAWHLFDMHGNVWEWVEDVWHASYEGGPLDGTAWLNGGAPATRVVRGGCWKTLPRQLRSSARLACPSELKSSYVGFRLARTV